MSNKSKFFFSGLWTLPLGLILGTVYLFFIKSLRGIFSDPINKPPDYLISFLLTFTPVLITFIINVVKYLQGERDFTPSIVLSNNRGVSKDKYKAQHHAPPKEYLSNEPRELTVGRYKGKYVFIPFLNSPEHSLIAGSPRCLKNNYITQWDFVEWQFCI